MDMDMNMNMDDDEGGASLPGQQAGVHRPDTHVSARHTGAIHLIAHADKSEPEAVLAALASIGLDPAEVQLSLTRGPGHAEELARQAARGSCARVIALGGDGTVNEVVNGLMSTPAPRPALGIVPLGTANDFARAANIPLDLSGALELASSAPAVAVDVGRVGQRWFLNVATGGVLSEATAKVDDELKARLGGLAYGLAGLFELPKLEPIELSVTTARGERWAGEALALAVGNARFAGGGFELCPEAQLDDGALDLTIFPASLPLSTLATSVLGRSAEGQDALVRLRDARLRIEAARPLHLNADGEPLTSESFDFDLAPRMLAVCLGAGAPVRSTKAAHDPRDC